MRIYFPVKSWYHDLCSCLQVDIACVLSYFNHDPLLVLGAGWDFHFCPGNWEPVEFFYPTPQGDLGRALAPYHPLLCRWHQPETPEAAKVQLIEALQADILPIVAVDNYHLPFRPAYHDVHAAHLVVVHGYDSEHDAFDILDPMPPAYQDQLSATILHISRMSSNPNDGSDPFFAGRGVGLRWLELRPTGQFPALTREWVDDVLMANHTAFLDNTPYADGFLSGLTGLQTYLHTLPERVQAEGEMVLREIYVLGWAVQASTSLHADFLALVADRLDYPLLREAGRWVGLVAHSWSALRIAAAHAIRQPNGIVQELPRLGHHVFTRWSEALFYIQEAMARKRAT